MRSGLVKAASVAVCLLSAVPSRAQTASHVLVVANRLTPGSVEIADAYVAARSIPRDQFVTLEVPAGEQISRVDFDERIQAPIARWLTAHAMQDRILYIVLTRGLPVRIEGTQGRQGTASSVDSELALLYRRMTGIPVPTAGPVPNPYFAGAREAPPAAFNRAEFDVYLVTRLDGFSTADTLGLIQRGASPRKDGRIVLDAPSVTNDPRRGWMEEAAARLRRAGFAERVVLDITDAAIQNEAGVLGYVSFGSNDAALHARQPKLTFVPGGLASMFLSSDARTFVEPPAAWQPGDRNLFAGSSQTLIGDLIRGGVTGIAGQVGEPFLDGSVRPDILLPAYVNGLTLAESFYVATPYLSWQTIVVGDPLCAPFRKDDTDQADDPPVDGETQLPSRFEARRLAALQGAASPEALRLVLQAETRTARGDDQGAIESLRKAVAADAASLFAWRALADRLEVTGDHTASAAAYQRILALAPNDVATLNNIAYNLAVHQNQPKDAYPFAVRAAALAGANPMIDDTLGWIQHLLGDDVQALRLLDRARRALPRSAEVQLHAAVVYAKAGQLQDAAVALALSAKLDPTLAERSEFKQVQQLLGRRN